MGNRLLDVVRVLGVAAATLPSAWAGLSVYAPANGGVVLGHEVAVDVRGCAKAPRDLLARLDFEHAKLDWTRGPYKGQWVARLPLSDNGRHELELVGRCKGHVHFLSMTTGAAEVASSVARNFLHANNVANMSWDWGPAVFLYGLSKLDPNSPAIATYQRGWVSKGVSEPDHADTCAPALTALELMRDHGDYSAVSSAQAVTNYILSEPRNHLGAINHMGHWFWGFIFPKSIWVDSLEMTAVFAAQWGNFMGNQTMLDFAAAQPGIYASVLQDRRTGLFHHGYNTDQDVTMPTSATFWLRGNGWVLASIVDILDELPPEHPKRAELLSILDSVARGLAAFQEPTGFWDSIANLPGATYGESSGTSLIAYAVAKGVHRGWLDPSLMPLAKKAFAAVTARLLRKGEATTDAGVPLRLSMPRISWSTDPGPRWYYKLIPAVTDFNYGVGAFMMAGAELRDEEF